jgi:release factor glutamine methyltransferase
MTISIENSNIVSIITDEGKTISMITGEDVYQPLKETTPALDLLFAELRKFDSVNQLDIPEGYKIADFGSGTGQLAVWSKKYYPALEVHAYDNDANAEKYILANAELHNVDITAHVMDVANIPNSDKFDVVISTPPFYPEILKRLKYNEIHAQDPDASVYAGIDGLDAHEVFIAKAASVLNAGGFVVTAHSIVQKDAVYALLTAAGLSDIDTLVIDNGEEFNLVDAVYTVAYKN